LHTNIGQRLLTVKEYLDGEDVFMANYTDGLTDLDLNEYLNYFNKQDRLASFLSVKPSLSFHVVSSGEDGLVSTFEPVDKTDLRINGGFFIFKKEIFDHIQEGEELVHEPFKRLIAENQLLAYQHKGFWASIDTLKEKKMFDDMYATGDTPWAVWDKSPRNSRFRVSSNGNGQVNSVQIEKVGIP